MKYSVVLLVISSLFLALVVGKRTLSQTALVAQQLETAEADAVEAVEGGEVEALDIIKEDSADQQELEDVFVNVSDVGADVVKETLENLVDFYRLQIRTINPNALKTYIELNKLLALYKRNNNPLYQRVRQIEALAQVFVIMINGYSSAASGTQSLSAYLSASALGEAGDGKVGLAFIGAVLINQNCNQAVIVSTQVFADSAASAVADLNTSCTWDFEGTTNPISPVFCSRSLAIRCCQNTSRWCSRNGYEYNIDGYKQLHKYGVLDCNCDPNAG